MIYIIFGNDTKKKNLHLKKIKGKKQQLFLNEEDFSKETILEKAETVSLFGESPLIIIDDVIKEKKFLFNASDLSRMQKSQTIFVFIEEKLPEAEIKKYTKFAIIEEFNINSIKKTIKINTFIIAEAFSQKDKIRTWIIFRELISAGLSPEEISGILFWKIKMMLLNGSKIFSAKELKEGSSFLVSLYHKAHKGETDFIIGLEQFILFFLSKQK